MDMTSEKKQERGKREVHRKDNVVYSGISGFVVISVDSTH